jgi:Abortive infection C-terminus
VRKGGSLHRYGGIHDVGRHPEGREAVVSVVQEGVGVTEGARLTRKEIGRLVHNWIGVDGGYLGSFRYAKHDRFWMETCDLDVDTGGFPGTTRECFEETLFAASVRDQAAALRAVVEEYPPAGETDPAHPKFRSPALHNDISAWISRLETGEVAVDLDLVSASEVVRRALDDADTLMRTSGPQSAVDRVHTAMHGYLHSLCDEVGIDCGDRPTMNQLFKALRAQHPSLSSVGTRPEEVTRVLGSMASILDALNPVRNNASVAHPNEELIGEAEAMLVINTVRTLLGYFESKRRQVAESAQ